ncbi:helix-turn-helix domain-containing protein [Actinophytocola glycyrrhizae]|uniref:Helix-turn-helix domain-containing protein n=1 Tax=Actinophytocola glycyrrhizae TaxID=2044873 RepID=A0ABV9SCN3_9PSEU
MITIDADRSPSFYTVREAAEILRCNKNTLYRAIHDGAFPAIRIRSRFVVPAQAVDQLARQAVETGVCVDVAELAARRRDEREFNRVTSR